MHWGIGQAARAVGEIEANRLRHKHFNKKANAYSGTDQALRELQESRKANGKPTSLLGRLKAWLLR